MLRLTALSALVAALGAVQPSAMRMVAYDGSTTIVETIDDLGLRLLVTCCGSTESW